VNGIRFVNPKKTAIAITTSITMPTRSGLAPRGLT
jgi:hypothetical protein